MTRDADVRISFVIPTRNRAPQLAQALEKIAGLRCDVGWELIVVDNGSTDDTRATVERFNARGGLQVLAIHEPLPGAGRARNAGIRASRGAIVAFADDDCYPDPTFLQRMLECFDENPRLGFVGGRVLLYDPTDYRITTQESETRVELPPRSFVLAGLIHGANFAFRRAALDEVGGFDVELGPGTTFVCEDVDLQARVSDAGWHGAYDPRPLVFHHHGRKTATEAELLMRVYDRGRGAYYAKSILNPSQRRLYLRHWISEMRWQPVATTLRELYAAFAYVTRHVRFARRQEPRASLVRMTSQRPA